MSRLEFRFLGLPEVQANGRLLSFPTRKALALLIYLAVEGGLQSRDHLAALLWPESGPARARATLRNGLHQLRSTLPDEGFLNVERDALGFNFDFHYQLDLESVVAATSATVSTASTQIEALQTALDVYRGDFLEGFTLSDAPAFDDWATVQREQWHRRLDVIFDKLSLVQFEQGQIRPSLDTTTRWLVHNPLNEAAHRRLMRLYAAAGERTAALQAYETCRTTLAEELGVEPIPETKALADRLKRDGQPSDEGRRMTDKSSPSSSILQPEVVHPSSFAEGPLVGRSQEFSALVAAYHRAAQGRPQATAVIGEAGIGKSRLATDFLAWAQAQGADVVRGRSFESGRQLPYQPLIDALRPYVEAINAPEDYLSNTWLAELSRLLPELLDRYPDLQPAHLDEAVARSRLFEAITRLTLSLAERTPADSPLLLFLDDLQWADAASLDVLQYVCRRWQDRDTPVLLLVTARTEALHPMSVAHTPQLAECLKGLERHLQVTTLSLEPLTAEDTGQFVAAFGADEADDLVQWLFRETSGQPFYLVETLEDLRERGLVKANVDADGAWQLRATVPGGDASSHALAPNVPERVHQIIAGRLARLSPTAFDLLAAGAVLAQGFTFELLCQVADVAEGEGLHALDELLRSRLLREFEGRGETAVATVAPYVFVHDKIRDVAYTEAGDARRRIFHRRALAVLAVQNAPAGWLARHALAAGDQKDAFRYSLVAGDEALALFAARNAVTHYEQARAISNQLTVDSDQLQRLYVQLGRAYEIAGNYQVALAVYDELQTLAQERDDKPLELAALMARTTVYAAPTQHYDPKHVGILTDQALPLARELRDHAAESKIQWNLMLLKLFTGDIEEAVAAGEASLAIARQHNLRQRMAYALHDLMRAYLFSGRPEEGLASGEEAQNLWRELDNKAMLADNLVSTASALFFWQGAREHVIPQLQEALALSEEINNLWNQSYANHILGAVYPDLGYFSRAIAACEQSIELGIEAGFMVPLFVNGSVLAWIYGMVGRPELGFSWLEKGLREETGMRDQQAGPLAVKAFLHMCQGELDKADEAIQQSYARLELQSLSAGTFFTFPIDGRIRLARREFEQAEAVSDRFIDYLRKTQLQPFRADALYIKGQALLALGRVGEAQAALAAARQQAVTLNTRRILWEILAVQTEIAVAQGEGETAESLRRQAYEIIQFIAEHIDDPELQEGFLRRTANTVVLGESR